MLCEMHVTQATPIKATTRRIKIYFNTFTFAFSATETPSCVQISSVNERGRGQFQSMHSWMNQVKHPVPLLYNTGMLTLTWPAFCGGTVVRTWLIMCENLLADASGVRCYGHHGQSRSWVVLGVTNAKGSNKWIIPRVQVIQHMLEVWHITHWLWGVPGLEL